MRDDRVTVRQCVGCYEKFSGKNWMIRCKKCYIEKRQEDEKIQRAELQAGGELNQRPCDNCGEPYWPRYKIDIWCSGCYLEGKQLMAIKGQTETNKHG